MKQVEGRPTIGPGARHTTKHEHPFQQHADGHVSADEDQLAKPGQRRDPIRG